MNIFQAIQIYYDIKRLYSFIYIKHDRVTLFEDDEHAQNYILKEKDNCIIKASHYNKHRSDTEFVPFTKWNCYTKRAGNYKMVPKTFTVQINNSGILPHAPTDKNFTFNGLPARIIYRKMRKAYKTSREKQR